MRSVLAILMTTAALAGCGGPARPPCDDDSHCPGGTHCVPGRGCDLVCRADVDCIEHGGGTCDARGRCVRTAQEDGGVCACDDGLYCNGVERCEAGACADGTPPCVPGQACEETTDACRTRPCEESPDADGDGHPAIECAGDDCDDGDASRYPGNLEICDPSHDEDCDASTFGARDDDGDGATDVACCNDVDGTRQCGTDCDDHAEAVRPGLPEVCNGIDDDCSGGVDEGLLVPQYADDDGDMFGDRDAPAVLLCPATSGFSAAATDCDDGNTAIYPGATETCNGTDDDCDGTADEGVLTVFYRDSDGDGYGVTSATVSACVLPSGFSATAGDCNDGSAAAHPRGFEICDGLDNDCNGSTDEVLGAECTVGLGACAASGQRRCDGSCTAVAGPPTPGGGYSYTPAANGSFDHDCDGAIECGYYTWCCGVATRHLGTFLSAADYCASTGCRTASDFDGFFTTPGQAICGEWRSHCTGDSCCQLLPDGRCYAPTWESARIGCR